MQKDTTIKNANDEVKEDFKIIVKNFFSSLNKK